MGLLDDVTTRAAGAHRGGTCTVAIWLETRTPAERDEFAAALKTDATATVIHAVIADKYGFTRGAGPVQRHRRGECACGPRR